MPETPIDIDRLVDTLTDLGYDVLPAITPQKQRPDFYINFRLSEESRRYRHQAMGDDPEGRAAARDIIGSGYYYMRRFHSDSPLSFELNAALEAYFEHMIYRYPEVAAVPDIWNPFPTTRIPMHLTLDFDMSSRYSADKYHRRFSEAGLDAFRRKPVDLPIVQQPTFEPLGSHLEFLRDELLPVVNRLAKHSTKRSKKKLKFDFEHVIRIQSVGGRGVYLTTYDEHGQTETEFVDAWVQGIVDTAVHVYTLLDLLKMCAQGQRVRMRAGTRTWTNQWSSVVHARHALVVWQQDRDFVFWRSRLDQLTNVKNLPLSQTAETA